MKPIRARVLGAPYLALLRKLASGGRVESWREYRLAQKRARTYTLYVPDPDAPSGETSESAVEDHVLHCVQRGLLAVATRDALGDTFTYTLSARGAEVVARGGALGTPDVEHELFDQPGVAAWAMQPPQTGYPDAGEAA